MTGAGSVRTRRSARRPQARRPAARRGQLHPVGAAGRTSCAGWRLVAAARRPAGRSRPVAQQHRPCQEELANFVAARGLRARQAPRSSGSNSSPPARRASPSRATVGPDDRGRRAAAGVALRPRPPTASRAISSALAPAVPFLRVLDGRPFEAAADVVLAPAGAVLPQRPLQGRRGDAYRQCALTGARGAARGRLEAQVAVQGLDLDQLPQVSSRLRRDRRTRRRLHPRRPRRAPAGSARRRPDLPRASSRTARRCSSRASTSSISPAPMRGSAAASRPDGSGRIAGKVTAQRAAPARRSSRQRLDRRRLEARAALPARGRSRPRRRHASARRPSQRLVRAAPADHRARHRRRRPLRRPRSMTVDGTTESLDVRSRPRIPGVWVERPDVPFLRRPSQRQPARHAGRLGPLQRHRSTAMSAASVVTTTRPFALGRTTMSSIAARRRSRPPIVTPFLALLGDGAGVEGPLPCRGTHRRSGASGDASLSTSPAAIADAASRRGFSPVRAPTSAAP